MIFIEVMMKDIAEDEKKYIKTWIIVSIKALVFSRMNTA